MEKLERNLARKLVNQKGKKLSEEHRRKLSLSRTGEKHFMYGKHHSEETKRKISLAHKGKGLGNKHAIGSKGHTGLKWITDGIIEKQYQ